MTDLSELGLVRLAYCPGTEVLLRGSGGMKALVLAASLTKGRTIYNCSWWKDGERKECWFEEFELEAVA